MPDPMLLHEVMHLLRKKLRAIIRYDLLWKTICREKMTEHFDSLICSGRGCRENLGPLQMGVYHHEEVHTVLLCIIHVHTLPNSHRPLSWNQGCSRRLFPSRLTRCTILHDRLNCLVETGPPHVTPSQRFHTANTWVISVKVFQDPVV